jgi:hypothetical protein
MLQNIRIANESFENVAKFEYLVTTLTNQNDIRDEIKSRLNSGNACYFSVQNLLSSRLTKTLKIKVYKTVILPVVLHGCETWSLTLMEEHRLRVSENRVLRRIFGPKREEEGSWRKLHSDELHSLYSSPNIVTVIKIKEVEVGGTCGTHGGRERRLQGFSWEARRQEPLRRPRRRWEDNIKMDLREKGWMGRTGFGWLRIWSNGGLL